jgi:hypothetical protein
MGRPTRAAVTVLGLLALAGCTDSQERDLTPWLRMEIVRPVTGTSGVIVLGSPREVFSARVGSGWIELGSGHPCRYMVLADGAAALVDLNDRKGVRLVREGESALRPLRETFGGTGDPFVPPGGRAVDIFACNVRGRGDACRDLQIDRHGIDGKRIETFQVQMPEAYPECDLLGLRGYDAAGVPYLNGQCAAGAPTRCLLVAPRRDGLWVHAVGTDRPAVECADFPSARVSLRPVENFEVMF